MSDPALSQRTTLLLLALLLATLGSMFAVSYKRHQSVAFESVSESGAPSLPPHLLSRLGPDVGVFIVPTLGQFALWLNKPDLIQDTLKQGKVWEPEYQRLFEYFVTPEDVVVDAGAYIGSHTVKLAQLAHRGQVHAFEPQQIALRLLHENIALNKLTNVVVHETALGDHAGFISMHVRDENNLGATAVVNDPTDHIPLETLDSLHLTALDFVKIDVEDSELVLLEGAKQTIARFRPVLAIESGEWNQPKLYEFLDRLNYDHQVFSPRQILAQPKERAVRYPPQHSS
ncbi:MAG: FkbM family methyltransferase [Bdellovibrionota bacterium]